MGISRGKNMRTTACGLLLRCPGWNGRTSSAVLLSSRRLPETWQELTARKRSNGHRCQRVEGLDRLRHADFAAARFFPQDIVELGRKKRSEELTVQMSRRGASSEWISGTNPLTATLASTT
jgi:hypothetical protein